MKKILIVLLGFALAIGVFAFGMNTAYAAGPTDAPSSGECASILPDDWCDPDKDGVWEILGLVLNIMTAGVGVLATIGMIISGIQWMTARDKEDQIVKAKNRIFNIVIGLVVWGLMWLVLSWLMPGELRLTP